MSGHIAVLPPQLDRLQAGWLALSPWPLSALAAAGISLVSGSENLAELGTDPVSIATATNRLHAAGLLGDGPESANPDIAARRAELAFLAHGRSGAPGAITLALSSDKGPDGLGAETVELNLFPARTGAGELVVGNLLQDPARPIALAAIATPLRVGQAVTTHLVEHGHSADWLVDAGSVHLLTARSRPLGGIKTGIQIVKLFRNDTAFQVFGAHGGAASMVPIDAFAGWLGDLINQTLF